MLNPQKVLAKYTPSDGDEITLTTNVVRNVLSNNPNVTDQEILFFVAMCKAQKLNPFTREAYLVKYGNNPATQLVSYWVLVKRAVQNPLYVGMESGLVKLSPDGSKIKRVPGYASYGALGGKVIGAWCKVHLKGYEVPIYAEVDFDEFAGRKKDSSLNSMWKKMPGVMIHKVAVSHALRLAFPCEFSGLYIAEEMGTEEPKMAPVQYEQYEQPEQAERPTDPMPEPDYELPDDYADGGYGPDGWQDMSEAEKADFVEQVAQREPARIMPDVDLEMAQELAQAGAGWEAF